jgi:hypothetical protein
MAELSWSNVQDNEALHGAHRLMAGSRRTYWCCVHSHRTEITHPFGEIESPKAVVQKCKRCKNCSGDIMMSRGAVTPGGLEFDTTCPTALICTRSLASAGA